MSMQLVHLRPKSPFRPVDWRWLKVKAYRRLGSRLSRFKIDAHLFEAYCFAEKLDEVEDEMDSVELCEQNEHIFDAHTFYSDNSKTSHRWELEARLLAKESYSSIAQKMSLDIETINTYEKIFFNVSDRLENVSWIIHSVVGRSIHVGLTERDFDLLWKMYGYFGGPVMLDMVIRRIGIKKQHAESEDEANGLLASALPVQANMNASKAMVINPINNFTAVSAMTVEQTYRQIEKDSAAGGGIEVITAGLGKVFNSLYWSTGSGTMKHRTLPLMKDVDSQPVELRASEMLLAATGQTVQNDFEGYTLPEPEQTTDE